MARTDNFRKQHAEILTVAREINALLSDALTPTAAAAIRALMCGPSRSVTAKKWVR
jgi:hypothetical protein